MVRRDLRPLEAMTRTAGAIAHGDLSQRVSPVAGGTEVGQLGQAFNSMIDEIEVAFAERAASEDRLRRFLADASHELRTPLTSILGYSELFGLGVRDRPADLTMSLRHIRDEASQDGHPGRRPVPPGPVGPRASACASSRWTWSSWPGGPPRGSPSRPPTTRSSSGARATVVVEGDPDRLRQVIDNLAGNAVSHTPAGTAIEIRVTEARVRNGRPGAGTWAVVTVHDDGPGIDRRDAPRIFEAFYRSDPSRSRSSGGAGLGLAIVAAIVEAHGGTVALLPGPGGHLRGAPAHPAARSAQPLARTGTAPPTGTSRIRPPSSVPAGDPGYRPVRRTDGASDQPSGPPDAPSGGSALRPGCSGSAA